LQVTGLANIAVQIPRLSKTLLQYGDIVSYGIESRGAVVVRKPAGHQRLPTRLTNGDGHMAVREADALGRELVDVGGNTVYGRTIYAYRGPLEIIGGDEQEVQALRLILTGAATLEEPRDPEEYGEESSP
jgi:hypothetical protein